VVFLTPSFVHRLLLGLLVDELARMSEDVERSYELSLFLVLHADDPGIAIAKNAAELFAACTALAPSVGPDVQSCLETIQAYSCAHDIFQHLMELKGLVTAPESNGGIKAFSPCGIILRRLCLAAQIASFEHLAALHAELEVRTLHILDQCCSFMNMDAFTAFLSARPRWLPCSLSGRDRPHRHAACVLFVAFGFERVSASFSHFTIVHSEGIAACAGTHCGFSSRDELRINTAFPACSAVPCASGRRRYRRSHRKGKFNFLFDHLICLFVLTFSSFTRFSIRLRRLPR
jgi:hypothetical protein